MSTEPTPLSVEQPYSRDELVHLAENMRHSTVQQIVGATEQKTINRLLATIDAQATEIAALRGALEPKEREMLAEHSSAMQALLRWCAEDTPEDIRKGWEQESHEALRALAAGRPR